MWGTLLGTLFGGWKKFLAVGLLGFVAVMLYNLFTEITQVILQWALNQVQGVDTDGVGAASVTVTGFAAWLATTLRIPDCVNAAASAISVKFLARKIPFINW